VRVNTRPTVLVVEDNNDDWALTRRLLSDVEWNLHRACTRQEAEGLLVGQSYDLVLLDLALPDSMPESTLRWGRSLRMPVVVLSDQPQEVSINGANGRPPLRSFVKGSFGLPVLTRAIMDEVRASRAYFNRDVLKQFDRLLAAAQA
jgi:CheY-like chemotaxis protein